MTHRRENREIPEFEHRRRRLCNVESYAVLTVRWGARVALASAVVLLETCSTVAVVQETCVASPACSAVFKLTFLFTLGPTTRQRESERGRERARESEG